MFTHLNSGTKYRFAVRGFKKVNGKTIVSKSYPVVDGYTNLPTANGFKVTATDYNAIKVGWNKVTGANGYIIYRYDFAKKQWVRVNSNVKTNTFLFSNLNSNTKYQFAVRGYKTVDGKTIVSKSFPTIIAYTSKMPTVSAVTGLKATRSVSSAKLTWNKVNNANKYYVYKKVNSKWEFVASVDAKATSYTINELLKDSAYDLGVQSVLYSGGNEFKSDIATVSVKAIELPVVTGLKANNITLNSVKLVWNKNNSASQYYIYKKVNSNWTKIATVNSDKLNYEVTNLTDNTEYEFSVSAVKKVENDLVEGNKTNIKIKTLKECTGEHHWTTTTVKELVQEAYDEDVLMVRRTLVCSCGMEFYSDWYEFDKVTVPATKDDGIWCEAKKCWYDWTDSYRSLSTKKYLNTEKML